MPLRTQRLDGDIELHQQLTGVPFKIRRRTDGAQAGTNLVEITKLDGTPIVSVSDTGIVTAVSFVGDGSGLTGVSGGSGGTSTPASSAVLGAVKTDVDPATGVDPVVYLTGSVDTLLAGKSNVGHTHDFDALTNRPTTLGDYGITDAYTKTTADARYLRLSGVASQTMAGDFLIDSANGRTYGLTNFATGQTVHFWMAGSTIGWDATWGQPSVIKDWNGIQFYSQATEIARFGISAASADAYFMGKVGFGGRKTPAEAVDVLGNVKATGFIGDGSQLTNLPAATQGDAAQLRSRTITTTAPADGEALYWNATATEFEFKKPIFFDAAFGGDVGGTYNAVSVKKIMGRAIIPVFNPTDGQTIVWDNANSYFKPLTILPGRPSASFVLLQADATALPNSRVLVAGEGVTIDDDGTQVSISAGGAGGGGGAGARTSTAYATPSLAASATDAATMPLGKGFVLYRITTSAPARVRLYSTATARTLDSARAVGTDPEPGSGVIADVVTTPDALSVTLAPFVYGANMETVPTIDIPVAITNRSGAATAITVTIVKVVTEV